MYDPGEQDEPPLHSLNGKEIDHYAGGKPLECPLCAALYARLYPHDAHTVQRRPDGSDYCDTCQEVIAPA